KTSSIAQIKPRRLKHKKLYSMIYSLVLPHSIPQTRSEEYLFMPSIHVCQRAKPYLIILVTTAPHNRKARQAIRDTWGGEIQVRGHRVMTLFIVGQPSDPVIGKELIEESKERGDLIQGRFIDSYGNLTLKTLSMLGWARRFCPQAHYLAKVDDDVLFNPSALLQYLNLRFKTEENDLTELYLGRVHMQVAPDHNPASKHFMSETAYAGMVFPDYCSGTAYVLSQPALLKLSLAADAISLPRPLYPEDVFVGICAHMAGITPTHSPLFSGSLYIFTFFLRTDASYMLPVLSHSESLIWLMSNDTLHKSHYTRGGTRRLPLRTHTHT
uniref:Hexosyltransferase n=1 Tax=Cyprinus carpio TaxID=7962 RepID=A0A8C2CGT7_CYPCA